MKKKKNNWVSSSQVHKTVDLTPSDVHDELAETGELLRVPIPETPTGTITANPAAFADELAETGEFPPLDVTLLREPSVSPNRLIADPAAPDGQVSFWLNHLASEIERLQGKWNQVDSELKLRETRIEELRRDLTAKDATVEGLVRDLSAIGAAKSESDSAVVNLEARLAGLVTEQAQSEARLADHNTQLEAAKASYAQLQQELAAARAEAERLQQQSVEEKAATAIVVARADELAAGNGELRGTIEVLESYIDRRKESWSELNAKLAEYQDTLVTSERTAKDQQRRSAEQEKAKEQLSKQVLDLEGRSADLVGRLKERETAHDALQSELTRQIDASAKLRTDLETRIQETAETIAKLEHQTQLRIAREQDLAKRDATIAELEKVREEQRRLAAEAAVINEQRAARIAELEAAHQERSKQLEALNVEIADRRKQTESLTADVSSRDTRLAQLEEAARDNARALQEVQQQLEHVGREHRDAVSDLSTAQNRIAELTRLLSEATRETERLNTHLAEREQFIARLESDLLAKQKALDLLDRNVKLINSLGASLQDFDRGLPANAQQVLAAAGAVARGTSQMLVDDKGHAYALDKDDTTIGRSELVDIVIRNPFISRVHARIVKRDAGTLIEDPGSRNGVWVNNRAIAHRTILRDGDTISLGGALELRFVDSTERKPLQPAH